MKIIVAITGGIAAYKAVDVISGLISKGHEVKVIATDTALNYVTPHVLNVMSKDNYVTETPGETKHIELAKWCDGFVMVPATANTIAKITNGFADNLVTTTFLALHKETHKFICPAMNTHMWANEFVEDNMKKLKGQHYLQSSPEKRPSNLTVIDPVSGMLACGDNGVGKLAPSRQIIEIVCDTLEKFPIWSFPLGNKNGIVRGSTIDSFSFLDFDWTRDTEIPVFPHVGAFGTRRRHDVHTGIDLYASIGEPVFAVEDGKVIEISPFTGEIAGFPWWEDTWAVYVEGNSGVVAYCEIKPTPQLKVGDPVRQNRDCLGTVLKVLKKDKGRPQSMLHLELHRPGLTRYPEWEIGKPCPEGVLDPTKYLLKCIKPIVQL